MELDLSLFFYYYDFMQNVISITSKGQLTIPKSIVDKLGIKTPSKAVIKSEKHKIVIEPKKDFWSLESSLKSKIKLSDNQLRHAREAFSHTWAEK